MIRIPLTITRKKSMEKKDAQLLAIRLAKVALENKPDAIFYSRSPSDNAARLAEFITTLAAKMEGLEDQNGKSMLELL